MKASPTIITAITTVPMIKRTNHTVATPSAYRTRARHLRASVSCRRRHRSGPGVRPWLADEECGDLRGTLEEDRLAMRDDKSKPHVHHDLLVAYDDHHGRAGRITFSDPDLAARYLEDHARAWLGDIFFDHQRGVMIENPAPLVTDPPFLVVFWLRDRELSVRSCTITAYQDAPSAIAAAREIIEREGTGDDDTELEVYCVRVTQASR
jgi:hypothetical protein